MEITQKQIEQAESGQAVEIADDGKSFVLIRRDLYDRLKHVLGYDDSELTPEEMSRAAWEAGRSIGWDEPGMEIYDDYEKHRP